MRLFFLSLIFLFSVAYGKVYDCFLFFNEWEVVELRMEELYPYVDKFVIVEANEGFRGAPKPYNFEKEGERYKRFEDKIIYIKLDKRIKTSNPWKREFWQRDQIMQGLKGCQPDDLIIISDADEYIPGYVVQELCKPEYAHRKIGFWQDFYRWYLNRSVGWKWNGTIAMRYKLLRKSSPQKARDLSRSGSIERWNHGWHFSSMGGYERIVQKYTNFCDGDGRAPTYENWLSEVQEHKLVPIDGSFPQFVQDNVDILIADDLVDPAFLEKSED